MASGRINLQANDGKVAGVVFEDGASSNVTVTVPKEGGNVVTDKDATITSNLNMVGTGLRITGDFSNTTASNRVIFQTSTSDGATYIAAIPNGLGVAASLAAYSSSNIDNSSYTSIGSTSTVGFINLGKFGTGGYLPLVIQTGGSERLRIDTSGNVLVTGSGALGYGTGSGGTVTQLTSKSTTVTLNKPSGQIQMNNATLASNTAVEFLLTNSLITANDNVYITFSGSQSNNYSYKAKAVAGGVYIIIKNESAGSLSEALQLNFTVIKGAVA